MRIGQYSKRLLIHSGTILGISLVAFGCAPSDEDINRLHLKYQLSQDEESYEALVKALKRANCDQLGRYVRNAKAQGQRRDSFLGDYGTDLGGEHEKHIDAAEAIVEKKCK